MNEIIIKGDVSLIDNVAREWLSKIESRIDTINERTKSHTIQIRDLQKKLGEMK